MTLEKGCGRKRFPGFLQLDLVVGKFGTCRGGGFSGSCANIESSSHLPYHAWKPVAPGDGLNSFLGHLEGRISESSRGCLVHFTRQVPQWFLGHAFSGILELSSGVERRRSCVEEWRDYAVL